MKPNRVIDYPNQPLLIFAEPDTPDRIFDAQSGESIVSGHALQVAFPGEANKGQVKNLRMAASLLEAYAKPADVDGTIRYQFTEAKLALETAHHGWVRCDSSVIVERPRA